MQPSFSGWTASSGTAMEGTIHTLPWYFENGLVSDADSVVAFGPRPVNGQFSWDNGARFYYGNLVSNFSSAKSEAVIKGFEGVGVSRIDNPTSPRSSTTRKNWMPPVLIPSRRRSYVP